MINVNNFKAGVTFEDEGDIFIVLEAQHSKQGRGQASVKAKVKNLRTGAITIKSYTGGDKVGKAHIEKFGMNYLYNDGESIYLMMQDAPYDQIEIAMNKVQNELQFLVENEKVSVRKYQDEILDIELPQNVMLKVITAPDAVKGNTTTNPQKRVTVETGLELEAPMFIKEGDTIIVSTETGKYVGKGDK